MKPGIIGMTLLASLTLALPVQAKHNCNASKNERCTTEPVALPGSVDEFLKLREEIGKDPWGGATLFIMALLTRERDRALGEKLLVLGLHETKLKKVGTSGFYKGYKYDSNTQYLVKQHDKHPQCSRGHVLDATPDNDYTADLSKIRIEFRVQTKYVPDISSGKYKVFACSSGAGTCRPLALKKNSKGFWKVYEWSTLAVGCAPSKAKRDEADGVDAAEEL